MKIQRKRLIAFLMAFVMVLGIFVPTITSRAETANQNLNYKNPENTVVQGEGVEVSQKITQQLSDTEYLVEASIKTPDVEKVKKLDGDILLIIDVSGSMSGERMDTLKKGLDEFVDLLYSSSGDFDESKLRFAAVAFGSDVVSSMDWEADQANVKSYISSLNATGGTNAKAGITKGKEFMQNSTGKNKAIIVFSDGDINFKGDLSADHSDAEVYLMSIQSNPTADVVSRIVGSKTENHKEITQVSEIQQELTGIGQKMIDELSVEASAKLTLNDKVSFVEEKIEGLPEGVEATVSGKDISFDFDPVKDKDITFTYKIKLDGFSNDFIPINSSAVVNVASGEAKNDVSFPIPEIRLPANPEVSITKTADKIVVWEEGQVINYSVVVENNGESDLEGLELFDKMTVGPVNQETPTENKEEVPAENKEEAPVEETEVAPEVEEKEETTPNRPEGSTTPEEPHKDKEKDIGKFVEIELAKNEKTDPANPDAPADEKTDVEKPSENQETPKDEVEKPAEETEVKEEAPIEETEVASETEKEDVALDLGEGFREIPLEKNTLSPGEKLEVNYSYTVTEEDLKSEVINNEAVIVGKSAVSGEEVRSSDKASVAVKTGGILLEQSASIEGGYFGDKFDFIYKVTNTGDEALERTQLVELMEGLTDDIKDVVVENNEAGKADNENAEKPVKTEDVDKAVDEDTVKTEEEVKKEEVLPEENVTENNEMVDLAPAKAAEEAPAQEEVAEEKSANATGTSIDLGTTDLAPGQTVTVKVPHTINEDDLKAGEILSKGKATAFVSGTELEVESTDEVKVLVYNREEPGINLTKKVDKVRVSKPGDFVVYRLEIINIGNATLENVTLKDPMLEKEDLKLEKDTLEPMEKTFVEVEYKITEEDFKAGELVNTASVEGVTAHGEKVEDEDSATVVMEKKCTIIQLDKTADRSSVAKVGQKVEYSFVITNNGSETLNNIELNDPMLGGHIKLEKTSLAPKESMTVKHVYETTKSDIAKTSFTNKATVKGVGELTNRVAEDKDCFEVKVVKMPQTGVSMGVAPMMTLTSLIGLAVVGFKKKNNF